MKSTVTVVPRGYCILVKLKLCMKIASDSIQATLIQRKKVYEVKVFDSLSPQGAPLLITCERVKGFQLLWNCNCC